MDALPAKTERFLVAQSAYRSRNCALGAHAMTSGPGHSQRERQAGFTLVELVVALVVIAVTLALALTGLRLLGRSGERGAHLIARHDMLSRGADILRRDIERLERVVRRRERDAEFVFSGDERGLAFVLI